MSLDIVILAAGKGTRMRSALPKVLHPVAGKPMLGHVIDTARKLAPRKIHVVIGHGAELVRERLAADDIHFVLQAEQLGTGHAVAQALPALSAERVLILYGDVPFVSPETMRRMLDRLHAEDAPAVVVLGFEPADSQQYGRVIADADGTIEKMVEHKDATEAERACRLCNSGLMAARAEDMFGL